MWGQRYGLVPELANMNGTYVLDLTAGQVYFSSGFKANDLITLRYISDGLGANGDFSNVFVPKMAEDAMYAYILHAIISTRINQPEYIVQRLRRDKSSKLRNAKIRLSNIKLDEIVQVMRGKSKWIKY